MKRLIVGFGVAIGIALASLGSVAAQGSPESVPNNSVGITQASAHTAGTDASLKVKFSDLVSTKKDVPGGAEP